MEDRFDVVAVRIEREGGIVAWMIGALPRPAVVAAPMGKSRRMKGVNALPVPRLKGQMDAGYGAVGLIHPKFIARKMLFAFRRKGPADSLQNGAIETSACLKIRYPQMDMIDQAALVELHG